MATNITIYTDSCIILSPSETVKVKPRSTRTPNTRNLYRDDYSDSDLEDETDETSSISTDKTLTNPTDTMNENPKGMCEYFKLLAKSPFPKVVLHRLPVSMGVNGEQTSECVVENEQMVSEDSAHVVVCEPILDAGEGTSNPTSVLTDISTTVLSSPLTQFSLTDRYSPISEKSFSLSPSLSEFSQETLNSLSTTVTTTVVTTIVSTTTTSTTSSNSRLNQNKIINNPEKYLKQAPFSELSGVFHKISNFVCQKCSYLGHTSEECEVATYYYYSKEFDLNRDIFKLGILSEGSKLKIYKILCEIGFNIQQLSEVRKILRTLMYRRNNYLKKKYI